MTGRHLGNAEIRNNGDSGNGRKFPGQRPITAGAVTIAEALKKAGYATGGFGKWGLGPTDTAGSPIKQGFDRFYGYNCQRNAHSFFPPFLDDDEGIETINKNPIPGHQRKPKGEVKADDYRAETYAPDRILEEALEFLDAHKDMPFFLYCPFVEPHVAMHPPQEWLDRYPKEWDDEKGAYRGQNGYLPHPRPRAGYASMISDLDDKSGGLLAALAAAGLAEDTIIVLTSDHGDMLGERGLWYKMSFFEDSARVPLIVHAPGRIEPRRVAENVSLVDLLPAFLDLASVDRPQLDGHSLAPLMAGRSEGWPDTALGEYTAEGAVAPLFMVRRGAYKYIACAADPH